MSVKKKYTPKNATVSATTSVVEITFGATASSPAAFPRALHAKTTGTASDMTPVSRPVPAAQIRLRDLTRPYSLSPPVPSHRPPSSPRITAQPIVHSASDRSLSRSAFSHLLRAPRRLSQRAGRGGGIRTPTLGFGDRWSTVKPTPLYPENPPVAGSQGLPAARQFSVVLTAASSRGSNPSIQLLCAAPKKISGNR